MPGLGVTLVDLDEFLDAYVETALSSSTDNSTPSGGYPLDDNYTADDIDPETMDRMRSHCQAFLNDPLGGRLIEIAERLEAEGKYDCPSRYDSVAAYAGRTFWHSRNGAGVGFWEEWEWPKGMGNTLQKTAQGFGEYNLYVGDDGKIYGG